MDRYKIDLLGLREVRWNTSGMTCINTDHTVIFSGNNNPDDPHEKGVAFLITRKSKKAFLEWNPISPRIITARFIFRLKKKTTFIQVYAPTNDAKDDDKEDFFQYLQTAIDKVPKRDFLILKGDFNAKAGAVSEGREREIGPHGIGQMNENGDLLADICATNSPVI